MWEEEEGFVRRGYRGRRGRENRGIGEEGSGLVVQKSLGVLVLRVRLEQRETALSGN